MTGETGPASRTRYGPSSWAPGISGVQPVTDAAWRAGAPDGSTRRPATPETGAAAGAGEAVGAAASAPVTGSRTDVSTAATAAPTERRTRRRTGAQVRAIVPLARRGPTNLRVFGTQRGDLSANTHAVRERPADGYGPVRSVRGNGGRAGSRHGPAAVDRGATAGPVGADRGRGTAPRRGRGDARHRGPPWLRAPARARAALPPAHADRRPLPVLRHDPQRHRRGPRAPGVVARPQPGRDPRRAPRGVPALRVAGAADHVRDLARARRARVDVGVPAVQVRDRPTTLIQLRALPRPVFGLQEPPPRADR